MRIVFIILWIILGIVFSCTTTKRNNNGRILVNQNGEARLGQSNLYIVLPQDLEMYEVRGKEGYLGYSIYSKDKSYKSSGTIEFERGHPIGGDTFLPKNKIDSLYRSFLGKQILWVIYRINSGLFAESRSDYKLLVTGINRREIDRMILIFETLKRE